MALLAALEKVGAAAPVVEEPLAPGVDDPGVPGEPGEPEPGEPGEPEPGEPGEPGEPEPGEPGEPEPGEPGEPGEPVEPGTPGVVFLVVPVPAATPGLVEAGVVPFWNGPVVDPAGLTGTPEPAGTPDGTDGAEPGLDWLLALWDAICDIAEGATSGSIHDWRCGNWLRDRTGAIGDRYGACLVTDISQYSSAIHCETHAAEQCFEAVSRACS